MIKLVLTDLDDTLIRVGLPHVSDRAMAGIHALLDAGLHFGPVSGRLPEAMRWMFDGDVRCHATGAYSNGQIICVDGACVHTEPVDAEALMGVGRLLCTLSVPAVLVAYDVEMEDDEGAGYFVSPDAHHVTRMGEEFRRDFPHIWRSVETLSEPTYLKANILCRGDRAYREQLRTQLHDAFPSLDFVFPNPDAPIIDIIPSGWTKGSAVRWIAEYLGIGLDEVAVFGDSDNDLAMIREVPNSVAVANATPEVRDAARWHVGACADDGVADALFAIAHAAKTNTMPSFMSD